MATSLQSLLIEFIHFIEKEKRLSQHTVKAYQEDLNQLRNFLSDKNIFEIAPITPTDLRNWIVELNKGGIHRNSIKRKIAATSAFFQYLLHQNIVEKNPTKELKLPREEKKLPVFIKESELLTIFSADNLQDTFLDWRSHITLVLLYGTGIRLSELIGLKDVDVCTSSATIRVLGKRNKERIIPIPKTILSRIETYRFFREKIAQVPFFLVTTQGKPSYPMLIYRIVNTYLKKYTHAEKKSPHVLRHTFATHLLNKGAELNAIKELLGHESLAATQIYTHIAINELKAIFNQAHPRA